MVKLNTRTTVIACCNPKGSYDVTADLSTNTAIATPLLSRFDLVLILLDTPHKEWDKMVSTFLLQQAIGGGKPSSSSSSSNAAVEPPAQWDCETVRAYLSYVKSAYQPKLGPEARYLLARYYQMQVRRVGR